MSTNDAVVLRDLPSLLRQSLGEQAQVVSYETALLLPKGENYASTILKVEAVVKREKNSREEKLSLVAKMIPSTEFQKNMINLTDSFLKEIFVFEKLLDVYREVEKEAGIESDKLIDILPKFYGGRLSLTKKEADSDAALLMENIKTRGYRTMNRLKGLDFEHAKMAITMLARFHALGMAVKHKKPAFYQEAKKYIDVFPFIIQENEFEDVVEYTIKSICADPRTAKYEDRLRASIKDANWESFMNMEAVEPWVTINHGDFWVNNIMFHEENGKVDDVKFVDFQISRMGSPLKDLPYFLCASTSVEVMDNHFDKLLDAYHEKFIEVLEKMGCDSSPFTKEKFEKQLKKDASDELFHCLMAMKFFTNEATEEMDLNDMKSSIMMTGASNLYLERSWKVVSKFIEKGWI